MDFRKMPLTGEAPGASIEPFPGHRHDIRPFDHFDTITLCVPDAPPPDESMLCMAIVGGGRPHPRVRSAPIIV